MKIACYITAALLMFSANVQAKAVTCTVSSVKDQVITLHCKNNVSILETGQQVRVKELKKKKEKVIEGC